MVDRVDLLTGPGALARGVAPDGSIGGSINVVTKRAGDVPLNRLTATYMGKAQFGTHLDVGRRFGEDNQWGVRVNGVWRNGEGNIDGGRQRLGLASVGLDYEGQGLRWSLDALTTACTELGVQYILPAHGHVLIDAPGAIAHLKAHRLRREAKVAAAMRALPGGNLDDWVPLAYDDVPERLWPVAKRSLQAHVDHIRSLGGFNV